MNIYKAMEGLNNSIFIRTDKRLEPNDCLMIGSSLYRVVCLLAEYTVVIEKAHVVKGEYV